MRDIETIDSELRLVAARKEHPKAVKAPGVVAFAVGTSGSRSRLRTVVGPRSGHRNPPGR